MTEWYVLELTSRSDDEDPDVLERSIRSILKDPNAEIFIPAAVTQLGEDRVVHYLMQGYAFVRNPGVRLKHLEDSRYVASILSGGVVDSDIDKMREQIRVEVDQGIGVGDVVEVVSGPYRNLTATVVEDILENDTVQVFVKLRSKQSIVTLPRSFLKVVDRTPLSGFFSRLTVIRYWVRRARPIILWNPMALPILRDSANRFDMLQKWSKRDLRPLLKLALGHLRLQEADDASLRLKLGTSSRPGIIRAQLAEVNTLDKWFGRLSRLWHLVLFQKGYSVQLDHLEAIQSKLIEAYWLDDVLEHSRSIQIRLERIAHKLAKRSKGGSKVIQNVLIDGHNLACRCLYAPGMSSLSDSKGRPTGVILGFLRSLGALKKRFPEARIYVVWDGSSNRRKAMFADYKAQRSSSDKFSGFDQVGYLRELLPKLGVWQRYNPEEEADDVIATMVRGQLADQHNVVYSTDKDLLSLVTDSTYVLMPGVGSRKEIFYDSDKVKSVFGVPPSDLIQFRSLCGDPSDNIPGVSRVPKKVLRALVQSHNSVSGIYESGLSGVTKGQYERLRQAEPQIRLNLKLMSFVEVDSILIDPNKDLNEMSNLLKQLDIKPDSIISIFS